MCSCKLETTMMNSYIAYCHSPVVMQERDNDNKQLHYSSSSFFLFFLQSWTKTMSIDLSSSSSFEASATNDDKQPHYLSSSFFCFAVVKEDDECNLSPSWSFEASAGNDNKQLLCLSSFLNFFFCSCEGSSSSSSLEAYTSNDNE